MKIDKIKTIKFEFDEKGGHYFIINDIKEPTDLEVSVQELKKMARALSRAALTTYRHLDEILNKEEEQ